jgi:hypothetical protein
MKILAIGKQKESILSLPPDKQKELMDATIKTNKKWKDEGKVIATYVSPGSGYVFAILNYETSEEWMKDLMSNPLFNYFEQETYPVVDFDDAMKIYGMT